MKFYFCETCGKRLTDAEIHDKQLKGVFCSACAQGVMTVQFDAISVPSKPATPAAPAKPISDIGTSKASGFHTPHTPRPGKTVSKESVKSESRARRHDSDSKVPLYAGIAGLAVILIASLALFSGGDSKSTAKAQPKADPRNLANIDKPQPPSVVSTPAPAPTPAPARAESSPPIAPIAVPGATNAAADRASAAFETMFKAFNKLEPEKKDERAALLEAYLKEFGDSDQAPRAHVMLDDLRKPSAPPKVPDAPALSAQAEQSGKDLFNKKDLTGWTQTTGTCFVKDGEIVFPDKDKRVELDTNPPGKDFTLTVEVFIEDGPGAYFEVRTRRGSVALDRTNTGQWITLQLTVKGDSLDGKMLKGVGNPPEIEPGQDSDILRIATSRSGVKHVRSVKATTVEIPAAAAKENLDAGRDLFNKKDLTGWTQARGTCPVKDGEILMDNNARLDTNLPLKDYVLTVELFIEDGPGDCVEFLTRTGITSLDRSHANQSITLQVTVKGDSFVSKLLKGTDNAVSVQPGQNEDILRINAFGSGLKHIRSVKLTPIIEAPVAAAKENTDGGRELFNKKDLTGWKLKNGNCNVKDGELIFEPTNTHIMIDADPPPAAKNYTVTVEVYVEDGPGAFFEVRTRTGQVHLDRSHANQWVTLQLTVKGNDFDAKLLKGTGDALDIQHDQNDDILRIYASHGGTKRVRSVKITTP